MKIKCKICGKELKTYTYAHFKWKHNITSEEYKMKYLDIHEYRSFCNICGIEVTNQKGKKKAKCKSCSKKRIPKSEEHKKKLSLAKIGVKLSDSHRENISKATAGKNNPMYGKGYKISGNKNGMYGKTRSNSVKQKLRECRIKNMLASGQFPNYNKLACEYFEWLNKWNNWNGLYATNGGEYICKGYFLDYYEPNLNIVIEWDEPNHYKNGKLRKRDVNRQNIIIETLKCKFYRIKQTEGKINEFKKTMKNR